jgi:hypothetical protein
MSACFPTLETRSLFESACPEVSMLATRLLPGFAGRPPLPVRIIITSIIDWLVVLGAFAIAIKLSAVLASNVH